MSKKPNYELISALADVQWELQEWLNQYNEQTKPAILVEDEDEFYYVYCKIVFDHMDFEITIWNHAVADGDLDAYGTDIDEVVKNIPNCQREFLDYLHYVANFYKTPIYLADKAKDLLRVLSPK